MTKMRKIFAILAVISLAAVLAYAQTTEFTYQGSLKDNASPANANYDFEFALFDAVSGGTQIGATLTRSTVTVTNGIFAVKLDFGSQFPGANRYLEIRVRISSVGAMTTLTPRQPVNSSPYSVKSLNADNATNATNATTANGLSGACVGCVQNSHINSVDGGKVTGTVANATNATNATTANNALNLGGVAAGQYVLTGDARLSDARNPLPNSAIYIQNTTSPQAASFNVSGNGTAGNLNVNGPVSLGAVSPPATAPGQGRIYFDTATNKVKVSENGAAFVDLVGASGVSGSGTASTVPVWTGSTVLGDSVITQAGGSVGIGITPGAGAKLDVNGAANFRPGGSGGGVGIANPNGETGVTINNGSGTNRADIRFDGTTLKLVAGGPGGPPPSTNGIAIDTSGNVGIGTTLPTTKLYVLSGTPGVSAIYAESASGRAVWGKSVSSRGVFGEADSGEGVHGQSNSGTGLAGQSTSGNAVSGTSTSGSGVYGETAVSSLTAGGVYGKGTGSGSIGVIGEANVNNAVGVFGVSTSPTTGVGVYARNLSGGRALVVEGNAGQSRDKGGLVKAMLYVEQDGTILRCYNGTTNVSTGNCGFVINHSGNGFYDINFNFQVNDRFLSISTRQNPAIPDIHVGASFTFTTNPLLLEAVTFIENGSNSGNDAAFMIIVY